MKKITYLLQPLAALLLTAALATAQLVVPGSSVLAGRVYILEYSPTPGSPDPWIAVDAISGDDAGPGFDIQFEFSDPGPRSFFRARVEWE